MKIIDLSHTIHAEMPVYPGTEQPVLNTATTYEKEGFAEKLISMYSHTGTHIDAPYHVLPHGKGLDDYEADKFIGKCRVLQVQGKNGEIRIEELEPVKKHLKEIDYLVINCGWSKYWGEEKYFSNYPVLSREAAEMLAEAGLKGIGIDCISVDPANVFHLPIHRILMEANMVIIENLTNLDELLNREFTLSALPLKLEKADGSPVRAVALIDQD